MWYFFPLSINDLMSFSQRALADTAPPAVQPQCDVLASSIAGIDTYLMKQERLNVLLLATCNR